MDEIDLSGFDDLGGGGGGIDLSGFNMPDVGGEIDLSGFNDLGIGEQFDFGQLDPNAFSFGDLDQMLADYQFGENLSAINNLDFNDIFGDQQGSLFEGGGTGTNRSLFNPATQDDDTGVRPFTEPEFGKNLSTKYLEDKNFDPRKAAQAEYQRYLDSLTPEGQESRNKFLERMNRDEYNPTYGPDADKNWESFSKNFQAQTDKTGGYGSQWQRAGSDMIMIQDDGSAIGINTETGDSYALDKGEVDRMVKNGVLNTAATGYVEATGGKGKVPGGGVDLGKGNYLTPDGKIVNTNTTTERTINNKGGGGAGASATPQDNSLLMLLLLMMMMGQNKGGGGGAAIPALSASAAQLPYGKTQQAPGYRPGQGGITYFNPTTYGPKMARGGGIAALDAAGGRLLRGPGDGVSDDIKAQIGDSQPAQLADGEYVLDARTVSEVGNGSTEAGAKKLAAMVNRIHSARKQAKRGKPSNADKQLLA
jgi:hypothetical protein